MRLFTDARPHIFREGEAVAFRIQVGRGSYVAALFYGADGSTVLLFPNNWNREMFIPEDIEFDIPGGGPQAFTYQVSPPFGADLVQVVACTRESAFHRKVKELLSVTGDVAPFRVLKPDEVQALTELLPSEVAANRMGAARGESWGEAHPVVQTGPARGAPTP